jgi:hypothetical protein
MSPTQSGRIRGLIPEQDHVMVEDRSSSVLMRSFSVETRIEVPNTPAGDAFWAKLRDLLKDQTQAGLDASYKAIVEFARQDLITPAPNAFGHAMIQAAFNQIHVDATRIPPAKP